MNTESLEDLKEQLVLSKLSGSLEVTLFEKQPVVILNGNIYPYGIFTSGLFRYSLWYRRYSKQAWYETNECLINLWKTLDILPNNCTMATHKLKPTTILKKEIINYKHENKDEVEFYGSDQDALLYHLESKIGNILTESNS